MKDMLARRLDALKEYLPAGREAAPLGVRRGRWFGKLSTALTAGSTCDVDIWIWDITDAAWGAVSPVVTLSNVRSFFEVPLPDDFPVQVEWTGTTWAIVDFQRMWQGKADGAISKGSTGTISLWHYTSGAMADTTLNVTALAWGSAITSGKIVSVWPGKGIWYVAPWEC